MLDFPEVGVMAGAAAPTVWTWQDVLRAAADRLERDGWVQGAYFQRIGDEDDAPIGPLCAVGAMNVVLGRNPEETDPADDPMYAFDEAYRHLAKFLGFDTEDMDFDEVIQNWNDDDGRDAADVLKAMREASNAA